jgi:hypothetical protein
MEYVGVTVGTGVTVGEFVGTEVGVSVGWVVEVGLETSVGSMVVVGDCVKEGCPSVVCFARVGLLSAILAVAEAVARLSVVELHAVNTKRIKLRTSEFRVRSKMMRMNLYLPTTLS